MRSIILLVGITFTCLIGCGESAPKEEVLTAEFIAEHGQPDDIARRDEFQKLLIETNLIEKVWPEQEGPELWVTPIFLAKPFEEKQTICFSIWLDESIKRGKSVKVTIKENRNGKIVGTYSKTDKLQMK